MADRKYYVICEAGCRFESLTKEQIFTAIMQAVENGEIRDVDTGFVTTIRTINGAPLKFFVGTQSEYESLTESQKKNLFALITNDTTKESMLKALEDLQKNYDELGKSHGELKQDHSDLKRDLSNGMFEVDNARYLSLMDYVSFDGGDSNSIEVGELGWNGIYLLTINKSAYHATYNTEVPITATAMVYIGNRPKIERLSPDAGCVDFRSSMMHGNFDSTSDAEFYAKLDVYTHTDGKDYFYLSLKKATGGYINTTGCKMTLTRISR